MSLSSLIVQRGIASIREVEEALARQVLYGGDFVTNLFEVSGIEESALLPLVAESYGLAPASPGELPRVPEDVHRFVAADVAAERSFVPLAIGAALVVAVAEPLSKDAEQELTFALALPIEQRVAPLFRIRQALARDYGVPIDKRNARLIQKVVTRGPSLTSTFPAPLESVPKMRAPPRPPSLMPPPLAAAPRSSFGAAEAPTGVHPPTYVRRTDAPAPRPVRRRRGPLTLPVAREELEASAERDAIFDLLFEFARQFFDYTAVFIVHADVAEGRDAFGEGSSRDKVARVGVPLDGQNLLASARRAKIPRRARPALEGSDAVLMADLGRAGTTECVVFPIIVRTRVVALLFGDGGTTGIDDVGVNQVNALIENAGGAFERVIMRRKLKSPDGPREGGVELAKDRAADSVPPPPTKVSASDTAVPEDRPWAEELAAPIREIMTEPVSRLTRVSTDPFPPNSDSPPPNNILAVRRPSGRPIPREEPSRDVLEPSAAVTPASSREPPSSASVSQREKAGARRRATAPLLDFGVPSVPSIVNDPGARSWNGPSTTRDPEGARAAEPFSEAPHSPKAASPPPMRAASLATTPGELDAVRPDAASKTLVDGTPLFDDQEQGSDIARLVVASLDRDDHSGEAALPVFDADATPLAPGVFAAETPPSPNVEPVLSLSHRKGGPPSLVAFGLKPMPASEQQISVAPHQPPPSHSDHSRVLPSVIVDVSSEYVTLVERVLAGPDDDAEADLLRAGSYAMPAIMAKFPGPLVVEPSQLDGDRLPRVADCGPVIRLIASQRRTALPYVLAHVEAPDVESRFWATYLLTELVYPDAIDAAVARAFDDDARVRRAARAALRALAEAHPQAVVERLGELTLAQTVDLRVRAIEALGETREAIAVQVLLPLLDEPVGEVAAATQKALVLITRQDFGLELDRWETWWDANKSRHRLEWLIDALMHEHRRLRGVASEDLKAITKEFFGYYDDLPKRERERAQSRYREWWENIGRVRFSRAGTRGA